MKQIGIDENGFGSLTGPLVITGTIIEMEEEKWFPHICDSKIFFSSRSESKFKKLEEFIISLYYSIKKQIPSSPLEIVNYLSPEFKCFSEVDICFKNIPDKFLWADTHKGKEEGEKFLKWMEKERIFIKDVKSEIVCAKRFNELIKKGNSKFIIDLSHFCKIIKRFDRRNSFVYAGKIGGMKYYLKYLRYFFPEYEIYEEIEEEKKSIYLFEGKDNFKVGFFLDVEKISFSASVSSIVGKYVREIFMESFRKSTGIKEKISGYRDKKTKKALSTLSSFPSECIIRIK